MEVFGFSSGVYELKVYAIEVSNWTERTGRIHLEQPSSDCSLGWKEMKTQALPYHWHKYSEQPPYGPCRAEVVK